MIHVLDASRAVGVASVAGRRRHAARAADRIAPPTIIDKIRDSRGSAAGHSELAHARRGASQWLRPTIRRAKAPRPAISRPAPFRRLAAEGPVKASIDWTPFFRAWELAGNLSRDPRRSGRRRKRARPVRGCAGDARPDHRRAMADAEGHGRAVAVPARRRRCLILAGNDWTRIALPSPAGEEARGPAQHVPGRLHRPRTARIGSAGSRSAIHGIEPHLERFKQTIMTIMTTSC